MAIERKVIVDEHEYLRLPQTIALALLAWSKKPYGVKLVSVESGEEITDENLAIGSLSIPLQDALGIT